MRKEHVLAGKWRQLARLARGATGLLLLASLCLFSAPPLHAQVPNYTGAEILSTFVPTAINASGQMAGYASIGTGGALRAVLFSGGVLTNLGTLPGGDRSEAAGINVHGHVVGNSTTTGGLTHAFLYSNGVMKDLGTLPRGATSYATAINDSGQITGWSDTLQVNSSFPRPDHAFLYSGGVMTDLGNISASRQFGNFSVGNAINNAGQVVGWSINDNGQTRAFLYSGGKMTDLGTLGGSESRARGINDSGTVVGWSFTSGDAATRAFQYKPGSGMSALGVLAGNNASSAAAINSSGQIIGTSVFSGTPAFVYTDASGIVKLASQVSGTGWILSGARAINNAGQIIASGSNATVFATNFLLTPPAPATVSYALSLGWNLVGNGVDTAIDVASVFSDTSRFVTVWKWVAAQNAWAFYAPSLAAQGTLATYLAANGYQPLTSIAGGEGYWVNAKAAGSVSLAGGNALGVTTLGSALVKGWNLVSLGVTATPKQFSDAQAGGVTTLWAWNAAGSAWYFYAPSLDTSGGLAAYVASKGYLDFGASGKTLGSGTGFWVNKP